MVDRTMQYVFTGTRRNSMNKVVTREFMRLYDLGQRITILHGNCPTGVDAEVDRLAKHFGWEVIPVDADWNQFGTAAGPIRNEKMLTRFGYIDKVMGFPDSQSRGTWDCVERAQQLRINYEVYFK